MGVVIPQVVTSDRATGAQIIDGSVGFSTNNSGANGSYLKRTPSSAGNRRTWTWSAWYKPSQITGINRYIFAAGYNNTPWYGWIHQFADNSEFQVTYDAGVAAGFKTTPRYRDTGWYHVVWSHDSTQSTDTEKTKIYVNGVQVTDFDNTSYPSLNEEGPVNNNVLHELGGKADRATLEGNLSQVYLIDGQALGPEYFGFTDPLTNTWKPKKYINTTASPGDVGGVVGFGTNGFYLPLDGSAPIGQDQSGQGNDWTPVSFGGTVELDSPLVTGTRPILNTTQGGTQAGVGVFGSKQNVGYAVTYHDDGGGNKYYIDGVKQATLTGLIRGATYTFDTVALGSTHPFRFSDSDGGSEYTNGVAAITGTATTITIPYNAPNELYYYCTAHSGMGSSITGITTNEKLADQYASNCTLAFAGIGNTTPVDVSASIACTTSTKTLGINGAPTADVSNFYASSPHLVGNSSWFTLATTDDVEMGTGDYTLETYVYFHSFPVTYNYIFCNEGSNTSGFAAWIVKNDGTVYVTYYNGSTRPELTSAAGSVATGRWYHLAWSRVSGTQHIFVDGVCVARGTWSENVNSSSDTRWGTNPASTSGEYGNLSLSDFRIYKGVGKYTASAVGEQAFVVPSAVPDILPDTPSGVSGGSKLAKITDGAVSFDGSGDFLGLANSTDTNFGSGDFTVECHAYFTSVSAETLLGQWENGSNRRSWLLQVNDGQLSCYLSADGTTSGQKRIDSASGAISTNRWYHLAYARSGDTMRLFIDGEQVGSVDVTSFTNYANTDDGFQVGSQTAAGSNLMSGFISNARIIKGTGIYTSRFTVPTAPLTNVTNTKLLCCQSSTSATEGAVKPGDITANGDAAATNFNPFNTDINTVRGQETGYATLNPLINGRANALSDGNLTSLQTTGDHGRARSTLTMDTSGKGKFYFEAKLIVVGGTYPHIGVIDSAINNDSNYVGSATNCFSYFTTGSKQLEGGSSSSYGDSFTVGDTIGCSLDCGSGELRFYKNGVDQGVAKTITTNYHACFAVSSYSNGKWEVNFGQKPFKFPPPDGFQPLNAANARPETVISRPDQYVGVTTYSGDNTDPKQINLGMAPDLIWVKARNQTNWHWLTDSVRAAPNKIYSNSTNAEDTAPIYGQADSLNDFGFVAGGGTDSGDPLSDSNKTGTDYVVWSWKAGGNKNTFNVDNVGYSTYVGAPGLDVGSIKIMGASVGTKQGFSIIKYRGNSTANATLPHGLSEAPKFVIIKNLDNTYGWAILHTDVGTTGTTLDGSSEYYMMDFSSSERQNWSEDTIWNPTSTTVKIDQSNGANWVNNSNSEYIMYAWHDVPGLQKFGSYAGSNSTTFVELGFRPALLVIKFYDGTDVGSHAGWKVIDNQRNKFNISGIMQKVAWDVNEEENGGTTISTSEGKVDFLSNGFRVMDNHAPFNTSGRNYIYMAWAEAPSVNLYGGGANAR